MARDIEEEVGALTSLDLDALRAVWRSRFGPPPRLRSVELLRLSLAWRLQAEVHGGLDADLRRQLRNRGGPGGRAEPGHRARLRREWQGRTVEVVVGEDGFHWNGQVYGSLSAAAPPSPAAGGTDRASLASGSRADDQDHQRCAIYTRKSSEDGLEQSFNSLDAQREACAAYVRSQAGEGWRASPPSMMTAASPADRWSALPCNGC